MCCEHLNEAHSDYCCIVYSSKIRVPVVRGESELVVHDAALSQRFPYSPIFTGHDVPDYENVSAIPVISIIHLHFSRLLSHVFFR